MRTGATYQHITMAEAVFLRELSGLPVQPIAADEPWERMEVNVKVYTSECMAKVFRTLVRVDGSLADFREEAQEEARRLRATIERHLRADRLEHTDVQP